MKRLMFLCLLGATLAIYATMLAWSLPAISAAAGGLMPFDMRPGGYDLADASAFLGQLTPEGVEFYRSVQHRLDLFFPGLLALTLFFSIAAAAPRTFGIWRWVLGALALPGAAFDYLENQAVGTMLDVGAAGLTPDLVETANRWTTLKSASTTIVMTLLLVLLIWRAVAAWRARPQATPRLPVR